MKKISIFLLTFFLSLTFICKNINIKANSYISTNIKAVDLNNKQITDNLNDGCFISILDFLKTPTNIIKFINLHENKNYPVYDSTLEDITSFILILQDSYPKYFEMIDLEIRSNFIYFKSQNKLNNYLVNNRFINPGETYLDEIDGYSTSEFNTINKNPYTCLDSLLNSELEYVFISPLTLPTNFYRKIENPTFDNGFYKIIDNFSYGIVDGNWCYRNPEIEVDGELSKVEVNNAIGKFKKVGIDKYEFSYLQQKYTPEFGYYTYQNDDYKVITLTKKEMPEIAFDSNGYLKDNYFSIYDNFWRVAYVKKISKCVNYFYLIRQEFYYTSYRGSSDSGDDFYLFVAYLNFDVPIDSIEKIVLKYKYWNVNQKWNPFKKFGIIDYKTYDVKCTIYRNTNVINPFYKKGSNGQYAYDKAITKGNYRFNVNNYNYNFNFRICLSDDDFVPKSYAEEDYYTSYPLHEQPLNELEVFEIYYTYQAVLYQADELKGTAVEGNNNPNDREFWLWKLLKKIWNSGLIGKIIILIFVVLIMLPIIYLLSLFMKCIKHIKKINP